MAPPIKNLKAFDQRIELDGHLIEHEKPVSYLPFELKHDEPRWHHISVPLFFFFSSFLRRKCPFV